MRIRNVVSSCTLDDIDMFDTKIRCSSESVITLTMPAEITHKGEADSEIDNIGSADVICCARTISSHSHAHIVHTGSNWDVVIGGGTETDPIYAASASGGVVKTAYDHSQVTHAPSNAQNNSDILKSEIEEKLTGEVSTHYHRTQPQQWKDYPDTPEAYPGERYQCIAAYPPPYGDNDIVIITSDKELYTNSNASCTATYYLFSSGEWHLDYHNYGIASIGPATILASNYDIYATSTKETLVYARQNDRKAIPTKASDLTTRYEPLVNGDPTAPEIMFDDDGDIIMVEV